MRIAVLMGGTSAEREVSLASGKAVARGLAQVGHEALEVDVALGSRWNLAAPPEARAKALCQEKHEKTAGKSTRAVYEAVHSLLALDLDVVFLALHGVPGEDGTIQGMLELAGLPYTGSGLLASSLAIDKIMSKRVFQESGIPTPEWAVVHAGEPWDLPMVMGKIESGIGFPVVVKPHDQGSTVGLSIVERPQDVVGALDNAAAHSAELLLERYILGRELTVSILEGCQLPVIEIHPQHGIYDYECKYTKGMSSYTVPAEVPQETSSRLLELGERTFEALKCSGFGRIDFRLSEEGRPFCLEVNTIPGMTETSLVPKAARAVGIEFPELVDRIVQLARKEHHGKR